MDAKHLRLKDNTYSVQLRVPRELIPFVGKRMLSRSLKTGDLTQAQRLRHKVLAEFHQLLDTARELHKQAPSGPVERLEAEARMIQQRIRSRQITTNQGSYEWEHLLDTLDALPADAITAKQAETICTLTEAIRHPDDRILLSTAIEEYVADGKDHLRLATTQMRESRLEKFYQWTGNKPLEDIQRADAHRYIKDVLQPAGMHTTTIKSTLTEISSFLEWSCRRGLCPDNVFRGVARTIRTVRSGAARKDAKVRAWTLHELEKLFNNPAPGAIHTMAALALYTGCRVNELAEMKVGDVVDDLMYIHEAKTEAGIRSVPVHPIVQPLVQRLLTTSTDGYLVSNLKRGGYDLKRHHTFSKQFSRHKRVKLQVPTTVRFHSLRHNYATALERAGAPVHVMKRLMGHVGGALVLDVYSEGAGEDLMRRWAHEVTFGPVDEVVAGSIGELAAASG